MPGFIYKLPAVLALAASVRATTAPYIYGTAFAPTIQEYDPIKRRGIFYKSTKPRLVEFYSPSCGACQMFKPSYVKLAEELTSGYDDIEVYAVSCEHHRDLCRKLEIEYFPILYGYPAGSNGKPIHFQRSRNPMSTGYSVIDIASQLKLKPKGATVSKLLAATTTADRDEKENNASHLWKNERQTRERVRREGAGAIMAREKRFVKHVQPIGQVRDDEKDLDRNKELLKKHRERLQASLNKNDSLSQLHNGDAVFDLRHGQLDKLKERPRVHADEMTKGMKKFDPNTVEYAQRREELQKQAYKVRQKRTRGFMHGTNKVSETKIVTPRDSRTRRIGTPEEGTGAVTVSKDVRTPGVIKRVVEKVPVVKRVVRMSEEESLLLDSTLALYQALKFHVYRKQGALPDEQRNVLKNWLDLLSVSLPPEWAIHQLIDTLRMKIATISKGNEELEAVIATYKHMPRSTFSPSCSKGKAGNGFSCGFWKLLHTATVGVAEQRGGLNLIDAGMMSPDTKVFSPAEAADAIRDYMEHFYVCSECSKHFIETYDNCDNNRRCDRLAEIEDEEELTVGDWKELALWLWEFHNDVSVRLLEERLSNDKKFRPNPEATAQKEIEVIWPQMNDCIMCFEQDGTWDEPEVFQKLEETYWFEARISPAKDRLLTYDEEATNNMLGVLVVLAVLILLVVSKLVGGESAGIQRSLYLARAAAVKARRSAIGTKKRSA